MFKTLTRTAVLAVVAGSLSFAAVAPAQAQTTPPANGRRCSFASVTDPTLEGDAQTGQINGGPLTADAPGATIKMKCTIQVGAANATHNGTDSCAVESSPSLQTTAIPPTLCTYDSPDGFPVYMCTQATINGIDYFWDAGPPDPGTGTWSTSSAAFCNEALQQEILPGPLCVVTQILEQILGPNPDGQGIIVFGLDGDLYVAGIWLVDCRPFGNPHPGPFFPDQLLCPLNSRDVGPILFRNGDMYIDTDLDGVADPEELFWNCPPY